MLFCFVLPAAAQDADDDSLISDALMRQAVSRIATFYFKPSRRPRTVYFSDKHIKQEWLPKIANINFVVLKLNEIASGTKGYVFEIIESDDKNSIGFGFGEIGCSGGGKGVTWGYRISDQKIKLWPIKGGRFMWVCDANAVERQ